MAPTQRGELGGSGPAFSASHFFALDVHEIAQDPEVEEAAIRFANGDDAGAEQGLLDTLGEAQGGEDRLDNWLALFDLYRATGQLAPFESQALDFVNRFGRSAPQWEDMLGAVSAMTGKAYKPSVTNGRAVWASEPELDAHAVGTLQNVLLRANQPGCWIGSRWKRSMSRRPVRCWASSPCGVIRTWSCASWGRARCAICSSP
ncbi:hypothetical protein Y695_03408 [Hydrogenophaga sp. T4]|nr:hypothetical protein Y695_03408 [Hydrogenophaga sp. T4]